MLFRCLGQVAQRADDFLRFRDFHSHRTVGGVLDRNLEIDRYTLGALALPALLSGALVMGTPVLCAARTAWAAGTILAVFLALWLFMKWSCRRRTRVWVDVIAQAIAVSVTGGATWLTGANEYRDLPFRHVLIPVAWVVALILIVTCGLAHALLRPRASNYGQMLNHTELFQGRPAKAVTWPSVFGSVFGLLVNGSLYLLGPPAIVALLAPHDWVRWGAGSALLVSAFALFLGGLDPRFETMWRLLQTGFYRGGSLVVSLAIIVLGLLRIDNNDYVQTVFDTPERSPFVIVFLILYVTAWWYDYWVNRLLGEKVLALIDSNLRGRADIDYPFTPPPPPEKPKTRVPSDKRHLQVHGASRFMVLREYPGGVFPWYFHGYKITELVDRLASDEAAQPTAPELKARIYGYHALSGLLAVALIAGLVYSQHGLSQDPQATVHSAAEPGIRLSEVLARDGRCMNDDRPVILVAASGGGTRAALYTAAMLEAIAAQGHGEDVLAGSGVSGGGAALAYYSARRNTLLKDGESWTPFIETMKHPYIVDVLRRIPEWRMAGSGRMGTLLAESFRTNWQIAEPQQGFPFRNVKNFGLMLNTTLTGSFHRGDALGNDPRKESLLKKMALKDISQEYFDLTRSDPAGGRLVLTNLDLKPVIPGDPAAISTLESGADAPPVILTAPDMPIENAAALNANFPPVFSNSAIDVGDQTRYWVTDGGAADNRGVEMLLGSLRQALPDLKRRCGRLPRVVVVVLDAGAFSDKFTQDRGVGAALAAGARFAGLLDGELYRAIQDQYKLLDTTSAFKVVYLPMPLSLRTDSWGTHWMLQPNITAEKLHFTGNEAVEALRAMDIEGRTAREDLLKLVHQDEMHCKGWTLFTDFLNTTRAFQIEQKPKEKP